MQKFQDTMFKIGDSAIAGVKSAAAAIFKFVSTNNSGQITVQDVQPIMQLAREEFNGNSYMLNKINGAESSVYTKACQKFMHQSTLS